eukprot:scaffold2175_cov381-Prasinococcus_capsulatus_cf.AAC.14
MTALAPDVSAHRPPGACPSSVGARRRLRGNCSLHRPRPPLPVPGPRTRCGPRAGEVAVADG